MFLLDPSADVRDAASTPSPGDRRARTSFGVLASARLVVLASLVALLLPGARATAVAESSRPRALGQLFHQSWGVREGVPGTVLSLAQTPDGYLWLATPGGLHRFDGVRFERVTSGTPDALRNLNRLIVSADGALWIAHSNARVSVLRAGKVTTYDRSDGLPPGILFDIAQDDRGAMWIASAGGVASFDGRRWQPIGVERGVPAGAAHAIAVDRSGAIWLAIEGRLLVRKRGTPSFVDTGIAGDIRRIAPAPDGSIWVSRLGTSVQRVLDPAGQPLHEPAIPYGARDIVFDRNGTIWLATDTRGVLTARASSFESMGREGGLTGDDAFAALQDRELNIWIGTNGGLDLFRETALVELSLPARAHGARLAAGADGSVWIGTRTHPLLRLKDGQVSSVSVPPPISAVHVDMSGAIWAWSGRDLWRGEGDRFVRHAAGPTATAEAWSLTMDGSGRLWAVLLDRTVRVLEHGRWSAPSSSLPSTTAARLLSSEPSGRIWLAYQDGLVAAVDRERTRMFGAAEGLRIGAVSALTGVNGRAWVAGANGLAVIEGERARMMSGLGDDVLGRITGIVETADGALWLNADRGVVTMAPADVRAMLANPRVRPSFRVFDYLDGAIGGAVPIPPQSAIGTPDGRLFFAGFDHVVSLDPARIGRNPLPPSVQVQSVRVGDTEYPATGSTPIQLPIGATRIAVAYTALSLVMPERVHFRYRLEGVDRDWQEVINRREAFYTNLAPGSYTFRVTASNNDGVWDERGASVLLIVPPAFHQTWTFRALCLAATAGLLWGGYRLRLRQVTARMQATLEERIAERERIARELHDTLLQGVQGLILKVHGAVARLPAAHPVAEMIGVTLEDAERVLVEGRDRVRGLRSGVDARGDLADALGRTGHALAHDRSTAFHLSVEGAPRALPPVVADEAYWIGREALLNAFRHAGARAIALTVVYDPAELRVRCQDDGCGLDAEALEMAERERRWGVRGMRERAARLGARLSFTAPESGTGTVVELRVPSAVAYPYPHPPSARWRRLRHLFIRTKR